MRSKHIISAALVSLSFLSSLSASVLAETVAPVDNSSAPQAKDAGNPLTVPSAESNKANIARQAKAYYVIFTGKAMPIRQIAVNGVNILNGYLVSSTLPVNISGYLKAGKNELAIECISDPKAALNAILECREPGAKKTPAGTLTFAANESKGKPISKSLNFLIDANDPLATSAVTALSDEDKKAIAATYTVYWKALNEHSTAKLKSLFRQALDEERALCPENARFYERVIGKEVDIVSNPAIALEPLSSSDLIFKVEGDKVKLSRSNNKPLVVSNQTDAPASSMLMEVETKKGGVKNQSAKIKERLVRYALYFKQNGNKQWSLALPPNV